MDSDRIVRMSTHPLPSAHLGRRSARSIVAAIIWIGLSGCGIYTFSAGGHGTSFVLPPDAALNSDPVVQSWAAYSLAKSTCQISRDGERPSHYDSFECELRPREVLVRRYRDRSDPVERDTYLDLLANVERDGFLAEYVWVYLGNSSWIRPDWLRLEEFEPYRRSRIPRHRARTRLIGWWTDEPLPPSAPQAGPRR